MTDQPAAYENAPDLLEEQEDFMRMRAQLPLRERLVRRAAYADRSTLNVPETDGKATQLVRSTALSLARHDQEHGTTAGPVAATSLTGHSPFCDLRAYIRQEYTAWLHHSSLVDGLEIALTGGCGTEAGHMCAACGKCRCYDHDECTRPHQEAPRV